MFVATAACKQPNSHHSTNRSSPADALLPGTSSEAAKPAYAPVETATMGGTRIAIVEKDRGCFIAKAEAASPPLPISLSMRAPCHFVKWVAAPPSARRASSGGIAEGDKHDPAVWLYPDANDARVVLVVGTPPEDLPPADAEKASAAQCGSQARGIRLVAEELTLSRPLVGRLFCAQAAADEKTYWMVAHGRL